MPTGSSVWSTFMVFSQALKSTKATFSENYNKFVGTIRLYKVKYWCFVSGPVLQNMTCHFGRTRLRGQISNNKYLNKACVVNDVKMSHFGYV